MVLGIADLITVQLRPRISSPLKTEAVRIVLCIHKTPHSVDAGNVMSALSAIVSGAPRTQGFSAIGAAQQAAYFIGEKGTRLIFSPAHKSPENFEPSGAQSLNLLLQQVLAAAGWPRVPMCSRR